MPKASSHIGSGKAVGKLPRFSGKARSSVEAKLRNSGFSPSRISSGSSVTWIHSDGSQVRIDVAHNPGSPKINSIDGKPMMSHVRNHYHKLWSDGINLLSLDDRGYVVASKTANAHIPAKRHKESEFENSLLFEGSFVQESDRTTISNTSVLENNQRWLFELPYASQEYYNSSSEVDAMFIDWAKKKWEQLKKGKKTPSSPPLDRSSVPPVSGVRLTSAAQKEREQVHNRLSQLIGKVTRCIAKGQQVPIKMATEFKSLVLRAEELNSDGRRDLRAAKLLMNQLK